MIFSKKIRSINKPVYIKENRMDSSKDLAHSSCKKSHTNFSSTLYCPKQFQNEKASFLKNYNYCFFEPFVYKNNDKLAFLDTIGSLFVLDSNSIISMNFINPEFNKVQFDFIAIWNETVKIFEPKTVTGLFTDNFSIFQKKFDSFASNLLFSKDYKDIQYQYNYDVEKDFMNRAAIFNLSFTLNLNYIITHTENISVSYSKNENLDKLCRRKFQLRLPSKDYVDMWIAREQYYIGSIIEHESMYYKANKDNNDENFNSENWDVLNFNEFSFSNVHSFYETQYGKKTFSLLQKNLQFLIEQTIGRKIVIKLFVKDISLYQKLNLNDYFAYKDNHYRVVKIEEYYKSINNYITITALELIDIKVDEIFSNIKFENNEKVIEYFRCDKDNTNKLNLTIIDPKTIVLLKTKKIDLETKEYL